MNSNAKAWVAALRSGDYNQGKGVLRSVDDRFCCLGVACDLAVIAGRQPAPWLRNDGTYCYDAHYAVLPSAVQDWLGLKTNTGDYEFDRSLSSDNDGRQHSFTQIADTIETHPELFA